MPSKAKSFKATLERGGGSLNWTIIRIPFDAAKLWGPRGHIRVKGEINGSRFRTSLFPTGTGGHIMIVNKTMQKGGKTKLGDTAQFRMEVDTEERIIPTPIELEAILKEDRALYGWFYKELTDGMRKWIGQWITDVKSADARARRADQTAEWLLSTMEAERELPPALKAAFASDPIAHHGWERLPAAQRRHRLLGIFHVRNPALRGKRTRTMLDELRKRGLN